MPLWKIEPVARPDDSHWQGRPIWGRVVVRAENAGMARIVAERLDEAALADHPPTGNESPSFQSGFSDEKLYAVTRIGADEAGAFGGEAGAEAVLDAERLRDASSEGQSIRAPLAGKPA